jgi:hypothetical protein
MIGHGTYDTTSVNSIVSILLLLEQDRVDVSRKTYDDKGKGGGKTSAERKE